MTDAVSILEQLPGLSGVEPKALAGIAALMKRRTYKDRLICREGEDADRLWVLAEGAAEVLKRSESGRDFVVATLQPVTLFGQVGLFLPTGRTASIRARGRCETLEMSSIQVHLLLRAGAPEVSGPFRRALIVALSQQLMSATQSIWRLADEAGATESVDAELAERRILEARGRL